MSICQKLSFCCPWSYIRTDSYMFCKRYFSEEYIHTKILRELTQVIYYEWVHYESCVHYCRVWILCVHIYLLELWLWPSPDVYLSFLSVVRNMELAHSLLLNEEALSKIPDNKKPVFVFEWLRFLDKVLVAAQKVMTSWIVNMTYQYVLF